MKLTRQSRFVAAMIALLSMLFMHLALAAYVCPAADQVVATSAAAIAADMPNCIGMDLEQPSLCHAFEHGGKQSLDKPDLPLVQPFIAGGLVLTWYPVPLNSHGGGTYPHPLLLERATAPPLVISNCCFRI
ncbi:MAG: hypothetical protein H7315_04685 [Herminiimonas sp.]|nr:hypothetical protein [Herminiimonas sp.]